MLRFAPLPESSTRPTLACPVLPLSLADAAPSPIHQQAPCICAAPLHGIIGVCLYQVPGVPASRVQSIIKKRAKSRAFPSASYSLKTRYPI